MQKLLLIALALPTLAGAQLTAVNQDELAVANSSCAAFYSVFQTIVRPEVRPGYEKKFAIHLHYAKGLHQSSESQSTRLQTAIKMQAATLSQAKSDDERRIWAREGMIGCMSLESTTPLIVKEHKLTMNEK